MRYASTEHNRLAWPTKDLMRLLDPFLHNVARDLHAALGDFILTPLACNLLCARHVDGLSNEYSKRREPFVADQRARRRTTDNILIDQSHALGERRRGETNHTHARIVFDVVNNLLAHNVALIHDQKINLGEVFPALKRLSGADLNQL